MYHIVPSTYCACTQTILYQRCGLRTAKCRGPISISCIFPVTSILYQYRIAPYCTVLHHIAASSYAHTNQHILHSPCDQHFVHNAILLCCRYNANICCQQVPPSFHCNDAQLSKRKHFYEVWPQVSQNILHWSVRKHSWKNDLIGAFQVLLGHKEAGVVRWWTLKWKRLPKSPEQPKTHNNRCSSSQNRTEQKKSIFL